jgi:hypothetical protein
MALPLSTNVYYQLLSGTVFVGDRSLATGTLDGSKGLTFLGDTSELTLQPNQEFVEHIEHQTGQGHKDAKVPRTTTLKGNLTIDNTGVHNFQEFLRAKVTIVPDSTVTDEPYFAPAEGDSFAIGSWFIVSLASITNAAGTITYQPGVDYIQNGRMIYIPNGSAMAQTAIAVNYVSGYAIESSLFGKRFQELYLFFQGSNAINGEEVTIELFKVSFDPAKLGNLLGDDILQMSLGFDALYEPLQNNDSALGGFGNINFPFKGFELSADKESVVSGETFTITFIAGDPGSYGYTITGVDSADIGGEPLTGTFNGASATLTFTIPVPTEAKPEKEFKISLDNNAASTTVTIAAFVPFYTLQTDQASLAIGQTATITFNTNLPGNYDYTITGVNSADIDNASLTGTFTANGETLTLTSTTGEAKTLTLALDNGEATTAIELFDPIYELTASAESLYVGRSFTVALTTNATQPTAYTITGVDSADIDNAPLTGSFSGDGDSRTYTMTANVSKTFVLSLDNGRTSTAGIFFFVPIYCEQDLDVFFRDIIGTPPYNMASELVYCEQDLTVLNRTP